MTLGEKFEFHCWNAAGVVSGLLEKWKPKACKSEKDFELSLYDYLHSQLKAIQVVKQYAQGRIRADIVIGDKVLIELKYNLASTAAYHRLIGQLTSYKEWKGPIFLVLCGKTEPSILKELHKFASSFNGGWAGPELKILTKQ